MLVKFIVGVHLGQSSSDARSLIPPMAVIETNLRQAPVQVVVDGGFTNRDNITACSGRNIDLAGSLAVGVRQSRKNGNLYKRYQARVKAAAVAPIGSGVVRETPGARRMVSART